MTYVEWLRVRGALKWTAIVLGALFLIAAGLRIYMFTRGDIMSFVDNHEKSATAKVTHSVLADGTKQTVIDDDNGKVHITIDDHGYAGQHIEVLDRTSNPDSDMKNLSMGSMHVETLPAGDGQRIVVDTNEPAPFVFYAAFAAVVSLIVATMLGAPFARENDGHLEIALTKPISRIKLALATVGVDFAGIVAAWVLSVVTMIACQALFQMPHISFEANDLTGAVLGILGGFAWYAILCAATSSMKRAYGVVLGLAWPFALIVFGLGKADLGTHPIAVAIHQSAKFIGYVLPFSYLHFGPPAMVNGQPVGSLGFTANVEMPMLALLTLVYVTLAVFQWKRVEA